MNILKRAIEAYSNQQYELALQLFLKAKERYGEKLVQYHIKKCKKQLKADFAVNERINYLSSEKLDYATLIMLHNEGGFSYNTDQVEYENLISKWKEKTLKKSESLEVKNVNPVPKDWPNDLVLNPLPLSPNDYLWFRKYKKKYNHLENRAVGLSIIVPTFNRGWILDITLACLVNQETDYPFEVIVSDDGSSEPIENIVRSYEHLLDIKYVRQKDYGYQLCAIRNLGIRAAKYPYVSILDCDMAPNRYWVNTYIQCLLNDDYTAYIGPRKYVDTHGYKKEDFLQNPFLLESLPEVRTNNTLGIVQDKEASKDWRLAHFDKSNNLQLCDSPFRYFSGGNVAFAKKWVTIVGEFDEEFTHWGGEDNEFGYRLFRAGCFFESVPDALAYHQEPPGKENETDRAEGKKKTIKIVQEKVPYFYRKLSNIENARIYKVPLVTIYIPAYNCEDTIVRCVDSALNQTVTDLEVCICNDGSTDSTLDILMSKYGSHPRVRIIDRENGGIAAASNTAVKVARGYYIGQLDSDDYLEPDAVEICLREFLKNRKLVCVYTANRNVNPDGSLIANGYNWPTFSREKFTTAMIVHHFRMFTIRAWNMTEGFDESLENAVDYDMFLKLSEVGEFKHVNKICYNRVLHGNNTSIKHLDIQKVNHFKAINRSLERQKIRNILFLSKNSDNDCRQFIISREVK